MMPAVSLELIKKAEIFTDLSEKELAEIAALARPAAFLKGDVIIKEGQVGDRLYFIDSGTVEIGLFDSLARFLPFTRLTAGQILGELAFLDGGPRSASAVAIDAVTTTAISREDMGRVLEKNHVMAIKIYKRMLKGLAERLREMNAGIRMLMGNLRRSNF
ncbi:MAG: cyclic nucleotide-binding domain-containing protein [Planctomycetota bacterium]|nr:cyclic nucleotide-binding domain-containing protein [Planctomycetota bacterium]